MHKLFSMLFDKTSAFDKSYVEECRERLVQEYQIKRWDTFFMRHAQLAASQSKDSTKVGAALISSEGAVILTSFNGPPKGVRDLPERFERPTKYLFAAHAERNLIAFAAREGIRTAGCRVYCTHPCCATCAQTMIQAGVKEFVHGNGQFVGMEEQVEAARVMFDDIGGSFRRFICEEMK